MKFILKRDTNVQEWFADNMQLENENILVYLQYKVESSRIRCGGDTKKFLKVTRRLREQIKTMEQVIFVRKQVGREVKLVQILEDK